MTIDQIAKMAGVSKATVSRVLNGRPGPSLQTTRKVNSVIDKVGYRPAPIDRRPGMRRTVGAAMRYRLVAMVILDKGYIIHPEHFVHLITGMSNALADHGLGLIVANDPYRLPANVRRGMIDGLLLAGSIPEPNMLEQLPDVPKVWLTSCFNDRHTYVMLGNEAAGQLAAQHLLKHTTGQLAYVAFPPELIALGRRNHAFAIALREAGRSYVDLKSTAPSALLQSVNVDETRRALMPVAEQLASMDPRPAGLFCPSDRFTAALYPLLMRVGIRPMVDLPIVSCGNERCYLISLDPQPITIDLAEEVVGQRAVEHLVFTITNPTHDRGETLALGAELTVPAETAI